MNTKSLAAALGLCACVASAQAVVVLDQSYTPLTLGSWGGAQVSLAGYDDFRRAQTFTVGVDGVLNSLDVYKYSGDAGFDGVRILDSVAGTGHIIGVSTAVEERGPVWRFDLRSLGIEVHVGQVLAFELLGNGMMVAIGGEPGYAGGTDWFLNTYFNMDAFAPNPVDTYFVTTVDSPAAPVPEPAHYALLLAGLGVVAARARRRPG